MDGAFGFSGGLGVSFNNFSLTEPLRGGAGQAMTFDYQFGVSNYYRTFSVGFTEPWMFNTPTLFGFSVFDTYQSYYADLHYRGASIRIGRRFKWPDMYFRGDWTLRVQENTYHPLTSTPTSYDYYYLEDSFINRHKNKEKYIVISNDVPSRDIKIKYNIKETNG